MTTPSAAPARRRRGALAITLGVVVVLLIGFFLFAGLYTDALWFAQLHYSNVLYTEWLTIASLFVIGFVGMAGPVLLSIQLAYRLRPVYAKLTAQLDRYQQVIEPLRRLVMFGVPAVIGLFAAVSAASRWQPILLMLHAEHVGGKPDPQFGLDAGFYMFTLPALHGIVGFASAVLVIATLAAVATSYLYGAVRIAGREVRVSRPARIQIAITFAVFLVLQAISLFLDQFTTLYDQAAGGLITGAAYSDVHAVIPGRLILAVIALFVAALFVVTSIIGRWRLPLIGTALLVVAAVIVGSIFPWGMQNLQVHPSEASLELPYIKRSIDATRSAYGVSSVKEIPYNATTTAQEGALRSDAQTTANIRILDPAVVSPTFGQFQQFKQYYSFPDNLDVDRYSIDGTSQDAVVGVRELNQGGLGTTSTAYNDTFVYTHGYGLVAAYGNRRSSDGAPDFFESNIPTSGSLGTFQPRVYFGEQSPEFSVVGAPSGSKPMELDYASGNANGGTQRSNTFTGSGGPSIGGFFNRLVYALKFQSDQILLSTAVNAKSQILYDRSPLDRVQKVAPYLTLDQDPYPSVVNGRLVWIVDGYTTSSSYPYSNSESLSAALADTSDAATPYATDQINYIRNSVKATVDAYSANSSYPYSNSESLSAALADTSDAATPYATDQINYIRNSVKATVDAYSGKVSLYAWDATDPVLKAWSSIFPSTVKPMADMTSQLISHVRYPEGLFRVQRDVLNRYHITDAGSWYTQDDWWKVPSEPSSTTDVTNQTLQPPYYLTMQLPGQTSPTFSLYSTYIPKQTGAAARGNLTGYLAVDADAGTTAGEKSKDYGQLRLLTLPPSTNVPGPTTTQTQINTDTTVAPQLTLLRGGTSGSTSVVQGNLLTIPVGGGLLYVQPVYVKSASGAQYPLLRKVLTSFGSKVEIADTLDQSLNALFGGESGTTVPDTGSGSGSSGSSGGTGTTTPPTTGTTTNATVKKALQDANAALTARQAAYAANDLVKAAQEDAKLQSALERAIKAGG